MQKEEATSDELLTANTEFFSGIDGAPQCGNLPTMRAGIFRPRAGDSSPQHRPLYTPMMAREVSKGLLLVLSGPSGVGKTSIVHELIRRFDGVFSVSATTRQAGPGEIDGRDYCFISEPAFQKLVDDESFLEYAQVFGRSWYGSPRKPIEQALAAGRLAILDIDVQGAELVHARCPDMYGVFVLPPSEDALLHRLRQRGREDEPTIQHRFAESTREIARARASETYDDFVVNDDLASATDAIGRLVARRMGVVVPSAVE